MSDECIKLFDEHGMDGLCFIGFELCTNIPDIEDIMAKSDKEISKYIMDELSRNKLVSILGSKYYQALVYLLILIRNKGISEVLNVLRGNYT
jgi:hypothetical protein